MSQTVDIRLRRVPVEVHRRSAEHQEELQREFQLIVFGANAHDVDVPKRLAELIETLNSEYSGLSAAQTKLLDDAMVRHDDVVEELTYTLPAAVAKACITLSRMLDECDEYCRRGEGLLTLATPNEALAYRRWYLGEFVAQAKGLPPLAWDDVDIDAVAASPVLRGE